ncbi:MAG TPA: zinc-binding dehydrogenase [Terriglobales bacterium]|nr:zinc-binding dehydrogenase [Terriglobales bacterium]
MARQMKADLVVDSVEGRREFDRDGAHRWARVDVVLEIASHPSAIRTAFDIVRRGGRISLLGLTSQPISLNFPEDIIFKGITIQGINGRHQMTALLKSGKLDLRPVITDRIALKDFSLGMERLKTGEASKILVYPNGMRQAADLRRWRRIRLRLRERPRAALRPQHRLRPACHTRTPRPHRRPGGDRFPHALARR